MHPEGCMRIDFVCMLLIFIVAVAVNLGPALYNLFWGADGIHPADSGLAEMRVEINVGGYSLVGAQNGYYQFFNPETHRIISFPTDRFRLEKVDQGGIYLIVLNNYGKVNPLDDPYGGAAKDIWNGTVKMQSARFQ